MYKLLTGGDNVRFNIYLGREFHEKLKEQAKRYEMSVSQYIRYAIIKLWEAEKKNEK